MVNYAFICTAHVGYYYYSDLLLGYEQYMFIIQQCKECLPPPFSFLFNSKPVWQEAVRSGEWVTLNLGLFWACEREWESGHGAAADH